MQALHSVCCCVCANYYLLLYGVLTSKLLLVLL